METIDQIKHEINAQSPSFKLYLKQFVLDKESYDLLNDINKVSNIFIFSGVIRDFLIGEVDEVRDIDIVLKNRIKDILPVSYLRIRSIIRNSFGGLKLKASNLTIDAWYMDNTWGIVQGSLSSNPNSLIKTAFFNFSAIVYDYNREKFIYNDDFAYFLASRTMDVVYEKNPNIPLCLFNVFYYYNKYHFKIGEKLKLWIRKYRDSYDNFDNVQKSHLGDIQYENKYIIQFLKLI